VVALIVAAFPAPVMQFRLCAAPRKVASPVDAARSFTFKTAER